MTIGDKLIKMRKNRKISQEVVASSIKVTRQTISKWEKNKSMPDFNKIVLLCKIYNVSVKELLM